MVLDLVEDLQRGDHLVVFGILNLLDHLATLAFAVLLHLRLYVENLVGEAGGATDDIFLLSDVSFHSLVVQELDHELEGFCCICLLIQGKQVLLICNLEQFFTDI